MVNACTTITGSYSTWGTCILEAVFLGSPAFMTIGIIMGVAFLAFKFKLPQEVSLMMAATIAFFMTVFNPGPEMFAIDMAIMLVGGVFIVSGFLKSGGR